MKTKQLLIASLGAILGLTFMASQASALSVSSQLFLGEENQLSDNSGESQNVDLNGDGFLWEGDTLRGTGDFDTLEDQTGGGGTHDVGANGVNELTLIFEIVVVSATITSDVDGSCGGDFVDCDDGGGPGSGLSGDELANYSFGIYAPFAAEFGLTAGTMVAFYEDITPDYDRTGTIATSEATATNGTLVWELGFYGDADEGWVALSAPVDTTAANNFTTSTVLGFFNVQLSQATNLLFADIIQIAGGCFTIACPGDGFVDVNGSGSILGTSGVTSDYDVFDNVDLSFIPVPEPGTLGMLGIGLFGLGFALRRRRQQVAA